MKHLIILINQTGSPELTILSGCLIIVFVTFIFNVKKILNCKIKPSKSLIIKVEKTSIQNQNLSFKKINDNMTEITNNDTGYVLEFQGFTDADIEKIRKLKIEIKKDRIM